MKGYAWIAAILALVVFVATRMVFGTMPTTWYGQANAVLSAIGSGVLGAGGLVWLCQTPFFPWACRRTTLGRLFPCIDGEWEGALNSNFVLIAERDPDLRGTVTAQVTSAKILIKARLLTVSMSLRSRPLNSQGPYLESDTIIMGVAQVGTDKHLQLTYVYEGRAKDHLPTDSEKHLGAAMLDMTEENGEQVLDGLYWTNRNWKRARNTAGTARFVRRSSIAPINAAIAAERTL